MGHRALDAPADGVGAARGVHLAPRPHPGHEKGLDDTNATEVARALDDLLTRAQAGPVSKRSDFPRRRPSTFAVWLVLATARNVAVAWSAACPEELRSANSDGSRFCRSRSVRSRRAGMRSSE